MSATAELLVCNYAELLSAHSSHRTYIAVDCWSLVNCDWIPLGMTVSLPKS